MGRQVVKQPGGGYAVWSSVVDDFILVGAEPEEIVDFFVEESTKEIKAKMYAIIEKLEAGEKPYYQHTMSFDECIETIKVMHGMTDTLKMFGHSTGSSQDS